MHTCGSKAAHWSAMLHQPWWWCLMFTSRWRGSKLLYFRTYYIVLNCTWTYMWNVDPGARKWGSLLIVKPWNGTILLSKRWIYKTSRLLKSFSTFFHFPGIWLLLALFSFPINLNFSHSQVDLRDFHLKGKHHDIYPTTVSSSVQVFIDQRVRVSFEASVLQKSYSF